MRVAAIADIHANLAALEAVLTSVDEAGVDEIWCLGDIVGYGPEPDACVELVRERCAVSLAGNHDLAVLGALEISAFSEAAAAAVRWTNENIGEGSLEFLRGLEPSARRADVSLFHASPRDPVWEYVLSPQQADSGLDAQEDRIGLIGHSHVALYFTRNGEIDGAQASAGTELEVAAGEWLLNPGSVGQPRDNDPRAAWLLLDTDAGTATYSRVVYNVERTAIAIADAGLPRRLGDRLYLGH